MARLVLGCSCREVVVIIFGVGLEVWIRRSHFVRFRSTVKRAIVGDLIKMLKVLWQRESPDVNSRGQVGGSIVYERWRRAGSEVGIQGKEQ